MTTPLRMATPSPILEQPLILSHSSNLLATPHLALDDVQVYRIAIMRHAEAKPPPHPHLDGGLSLQGFNPSEFRSLLTTSPALLWTSDNRAQAEHPNPLDGRGTVRCGWIPRWMGLRARAGVGGSSVTALCTMPVVVPPTQTGGR